MQRTDSINEHWENKDSLAFRLHFKVPESRSNSLTMVAEMESQFFARKLCVAKDARNRTVNLSHVIG